MMPLRFLLTCLLYLFSATQAHALSSCRISGYPYAIDCETVVVNAKVPLQITLYKVAARVRYPAPEPVIWIADSIAMPASHRAPAIIQLLSRLRNQRDLLWLEFSRAAATTDKDCKASTQATLPARLHLQPPSTQRAACTRWLQQPDHLHALTTTEIARQYEAAARQLGLQQVTLVTEGRGAWIARDWQQIAPGRIRLQIHDSPPHTAAPSLVASANRQSQMLQQLLSACAVDNHCRQHGMHRTETFEKLFQQLPVTLTVRDPYTLQSTRLVLEAPQFAYWLGQILQVPTRSQYLPAALQLAAQGDWQPWLGLIVHYWNRQPDTVDDALATGSVCANRQTETLPPPQTTLATWLYRHMQTYQQQLCAGLPELPRSAAPSNTPSAIPTLVLTAQASAAPIAPGTVTLVVPGAGATVFSHGCAKDVIARFYRMALHGPWPAVAATLQAECLTQVPPPLLRHWHLKAPQT